MEKKFSFIIDRMQPMENAVRVFGVVKFKDECEIPRNVSVKVEVAPVVDFNHSVRVLKNSIDSTDYAWEQVQDSFELELLHILSYGENGQLELINNLPVPLNTWCNLNWELRAVYNNSLRV